MLGSLQYPVSKILYSSSAYGPLGKVGESGQNERKPDAVARTAQRLGQLLRKSFVRKEFSDLQALFQFTRTLEKDTTQTRYTQSVKGLQQKIVQKQIEILSKSDESLVHNLKSQSALVNLAKAEADKISVIYINIKTHKLKVDQSTKETIKTVLKNFESFREFLNGSFVGIAPAKAIQYLQDLVN